MAASLVWLHDKADFITERLFQCFYQYKFIARYGEATNEQNIYGSLQASVVDPDSVIRLYWIRIQIGNAATDPETWELTKITKYVINLFPAFFCTFVGTYVFDL
jgi:hypothetical protein